jgi:hypothetical protein
VLTLARKSPTTNTTDFWPREMSAISVEAENGRARAALVAAWNPE